MKLIAILLDEDYKNIPRGIYKFDDEFKIIEFNSRNKVIELRRNQNYYKQFESLIENISCIVGKNGMGKTTLFEILISLKLWRLDDGLKEGTIHALFYDLSKKIFFIQSYRDNASDWSIKYFELKKFDITNKISPVNIKRNIRRDDKFSIIPTPISIIFHSLSPFDRVYELIKNIYLKDSTNKHYENFGYIGANKIKDSEPSHNALTLKNLLYFSNTSSQFRNMLENIGYKYKNIEINVNKKYFNNSIEVIEFGDINLSKLDVENFNEEIYNNIKKLFLSPNITYYEKYNDMSEEDFYKYLIFSSLDIGKFSNFKRFLKLAITKFPGLDINNAVVALLKNILDDDVLSVKQIFNSNRFTTIKSIVTNRENSKKCYEFLIEKIDNFQVSDIDYFYKTLQYISFLESQGIIEFKINLIKNEKIINYLRLSSGEKTMLSYLFNIYDKILALKVRTGDTEYIKTVIILIDEVELHLHPEWQRQFIDNINRFFGKFEDIELQFIVATHSPIILSDILSQNTVYLGINNIDEDNNSFGGNILDIYKDKFFIEYTMGEFSRKFIENFSNSINLIYAYEMAKRNDNQLLNLIIEKYRKKNLKISNLVKYIDRIGINEKSIDLKCVAEWKKDNEGFLERSKAIINNIGEEAIRNHLKSLIDRLSILKKESIE
jgi:hypothetical protein